MAELTRYVRDERYRNDEVYRADEVDKHIAQLEKENAELQEEGRRELDSAISAGWSEADAHYMPQIEQLEKDIREARETLLEILQDVPEDIYYIHRADVIEKAREAKDDAY